MDKTEFESTIGLMRGEELVVLGTLADQVPENGHIVEIGSYMGKSTCQLAKHAKPTVTVDAIDKFPEITKFIALGFGPGWPVKDTEYRQRDIFIENTKSYSNIRMIIADSVADLTYESGPQFDMLFLDAAHRNPSDREYLEYFLPRMQPGAIISGHDYSKEWPDVMENVHWLENLLESKVHVAHTLWWLKKHE